MAKTKTQKPGSLERLVRRGDWVWYRNYGIGKRIWACVETPAGAATKIQRPGCKRRWIPTAWIDSVAPAPNVRVSGDCPDTDNQKGNKMNESNATAANQTVQVASDAQRGTHWQQRMVGPVIGNGKSPLRCLLGQFVYHNGDRGITLDEAFLGTRCKGLKWERRHVATALNNMVVDKQITADWPDGKLPRRYYPRPNVVAEARRK